MSHLPEKVRKIASDDEPWVSENVKTWKRRRQREYSKNKISEKYKYLNEMYNTKLAQAKKKFKRKMIDGIKHADKSQWYSKLKWISSFDQEKKELISVEEINHLTDEMQAEAIADRLSAVSNLYKPLRTEDINFPQIPNASFPQFSNNQVQRYLENIKTKKSTVLGDVPSKVIKECSQYLCIPMGDILNKSIIAGKWAKIYKRETITPIPKTFPPDNIDNLRPIANLLNFNKIQEKIIGELVIEDMEEHLDPSQYGNRRNTSIQHYLVKLIHRILSAVDNNSGDEVNAVLCSFVDWRQAYSRQCHLLGIQSFKQNGVRPSLLPLLADYLMDRELRVKWRGKLSKSRTLPGGGAMGATLGNHEFTSQTNHNSDCVPADDRFKWVDDLTVLEKINLLSIGISSYNFKHHVASDIPTNGHYIQNEHLKTQTYLEKINQWTVSQKMEINQTKTKAMFINFTDKYQCSSRLTFKGETIELVNSMKILGVTVSNDLSWHENTAILTKKVNQRMQLLRAVWSFGSNISEMVHLWKLYCLSILEQSCVVWGSTLTQEDKENLERTQKSFAKLVLQEKYNDYPSALDMLGLETLENRRDMLMTRFAENSIKNNKLNKLFKLRTKEHDMELRAEERYQVTKARTERLNKSSIPYMQRLLNQNHKEEQQKKD